MIPLKIYGRPDTGRLLLLRGDGMEGVADTREVLLILSAFLRGEVEDAGAREQLRAAELLGKRYGLFDGGHEDMSAPVVIEGGALLG
ncbi:MAG: hypothetical protein LBI19_09485 [Oscillospiraceae bacterium]|jgi:hypothetical protein|nr:hypothetical protein [Oscillospiraceae bacterium]